MGAADDVFGAFGIALGDDEADAVACGDVCGAEEEGGGGGKEFAVALFFTGEEGADGGEVVMGADVLAGDSEVF